MNRLFISTGIAFFVAASFLITHLSNLLGVYGCTNSSNTNHTASGINGTSGNPAKSALAHSNQTSSVDAATKLVIIACCPCGPPPP